MAQLGQLERAVMDALVGHVCFITKFDLHGA